MTIDGYEQLHEEGYQYDTRQYRMFNFSDITGSYLVVDKKIIFYDEIYWYFSSFDNELVLKVKENIEKKGIYYINQYIKEVECEIESYKIESDELLINMLSPIVLYQTSEISRKKYYYSANDEEFYELFKDNFIRKYAACYGYYPEDLVTIKPVNVSSKDKCVTRFKGTIINGYKGIYLLSGKKGYLEFLYNTGIGSNNSQGFGMFEIKRDS